MNRWFDKAIIGVVRHKVSAFEDLPDDWICPACGVPKDQFEKLI